MNSKANAKWFDAIYAIAVIAVVLYLISLIGSTFSDVSASASGGSSNNSSQGPSDNTGTNNGTGDNTGSGDNTGTDNDNTGTGSNTGTSGNTNTDGNSGTTSNEGTYTLSLSIIKVSNEPVNDYNVYLNGTKLEDIQLVEGTYYNLIEVEIKENDVLYIEGATLKEDGGSPLFYNKDGKYAGVLRDYEPTMTLPLADYKIYTAGAERGDYNYEGLTIVFTSKEESEEKIAISGVWQFNEELNFASLGDTTVSADVPFLLDFGEDEYIDSTYFTRMNVGYAWDLENECKIRSVWVSWNNGAVTTQLYSDYHYNDTYKWWPSSYPACKTIIFETEQMVSEDFYNWFIANATYIGENNSD